MQCNYTRMLLSSYMLFASGLAWAQSPYRMEGGVTDADTQQPVANTTVQVLITSEPDPSQKIREEMKMHWKDVLNDLADLAAS